MSEHLTWQTIQERFNGEWIQLVDYEWEEHEADPRMGVVRLHSKDEKEFHRMLKANPVAESAVLFVGEPFDFEGPCFFNANQHQWFSNR